MSTMGIKPGDAVLVIEHRGEQQIVHHALVCGITMRRELMGTMGEPAIEAAFVARSCVGFRDFLFDDGVPFQVLSIAGIVHISHRDWSERRAGLAYEELPSHAAGVCRFCGCTERRACAEGCSWVDEARTVCSSLKCMERMGAVSL